MSRVDLALVFIALLIGLLIGYHAGARNADAAELYTTMIPSYAQDADTGGVPAPTATPTAVPPTSTPVPPTSTAVSESVASWPTDRALTEPEMDALLTAAGWPAYLHTEAKAVACGIGRTHTGESNCEPWRINWSLGGCCVGLFQVHSGFHASRCGTTREGLKDPLVNAVCALDIYQRSGGWGPWEVSPW